MRSHKSYKASADRLIVRNSEGRAQVRDPLEQEDIVTKAYADKISNFLNSEIDKSKKELERIYAKLDEVEEYLGLTEEIDRLKEQLDVLLEKLVHASTETSGITRYATPKEALTGISNEAAVTPETLAVAMGQFGLFGESCRIETGDANDIRSNGFYILSSDLDNMPLQDGERWWYVSVINNGSNGSNGSAGYSNFAQMAISSGYTGKSTMWYRSYLNGTWYDWEKAYPQTAVTVIHNNNTYTSYNELFKTGKYFIYNNHLTEAPIASGTSHAITLDVIGRDDDEIYTSQLATISFTNEVRIYSRVCPNNGTWSDWVQVYPALPTATKTQATAGTAENVTLSPSNLNAAMSQFGLFGASVYITPTNPIYSSYDEIIANGKYFINPNTWLDNGPPSTEYMFLDVTNYHHLLPTQNLNVCQTAIERNTINGRIFYRVCIAGIWGNWIQLYPSFPTATDAQAMEGSPTDVTLSPANLKVTMGQFGLFGSAQHISPETMPDLDDLITSGQYSYWIQHSTLIENLPPVTASGVISVFDMPVDGTDRRICQVVFTVTSSGTQQFMRSKLGNAYQWSAWQQVATTAVS